MRLTAAAAAALTAGLAAAQATPTPTQTGTYWPTTGGAYFNCSSVLNLVVGDGVSTSQANLAQPVYVEERLPDGTLLRRTPLRSATSAPDAPACTLGVEGANWAYAFDGLLTTSADGTTSHLLCFDIPAGQPMSMSAPKTLVTISPTGAVAYSVPSLTTTFNGLWGGAGIHQVASTDGGASGGFWLSGVSATEWCVWREVATAGTTGATNDGGGSARLRAVLRRRADVTATACHLPPHPPHPQGLPVPALRHRPKHHVRAGRRGGPARLRDGAGP
jgi:hypothetical protein